MNSHLFQSVPVGALFFRDPFNPNENPSIKIDSQRARKPSGDVIEVHPHVLVFTIRPEPKPIPVVIPTREQVAA